MKQCPNCGANVSPDAPFCSSCGRRLSPGDVTPAADIQETGILNQSPVPETAYLEFLGGPEDGRIILLSGDRVTVGRRDDSDIVIQSDPALSRRHAYIYRQDQEFWIEDRKSSFGTWVADKRVPIETSAPMKDGDFIRLARTTLHFHLGRPKNVELRALVKQAQE